jgi:hypothetical protein
MMLLAIVGVNLCLASPVSAQKKPTLEGVTKDINAVIAGSNARYYAVKRLAEYDGPLPEKQAEVAALLLKTVKENQDRAYDCMLALGVWATEAELKEVREYLGNSRFAKAAANVLSKKRYPPAAKELAPLLEGGPIDRKDVVAALILIGPECEELVFPYLASKDKNAVRGAVDILNRVGTSKSIEPLKQAGKTFEKDKNISTGVKQALNKIEDRLKEGKDK